MMTTENKLHLPGILKDGLPYTVDSSDVDMNGVLKSRPSERSITDSMKEKAAEHLVKILMARDPQEDEEEIREVADECVEDEYTWWQGDGYKLARELEDNHGYDPDSSLVDDLDSHSYYLARLAEDSVKSWVKSSGFTLALSGGTKVRVKRPFMPKEKLENYVGEVVISSYHEKALKLGKDSDDQLRYTLKFAGQESNVIGSILPAEFIMEVLPDDAELTTYR